MIAESLVALLVEKRQASDRLCDHSFRKRARPRQGTHQACGISCHATIASLCALCLREGALDYRWDADKREQMGQALDYFYLEALLPIRKNPATPQISSTNGQNTTYIISVPYSSKHPIIGEEMKKETILNFRCPRLISPDCLFLRRRTAVCPTIRKG